MKANASTSTEFELEDYKLQKKLSLQPLFMPLFRYQLLFEKVLSSLYNPSGYNNNESQIDFSNKSIFIYNYKKRKNIDNSKKKPNSVKNINFDKLDLKRNSNQHFSQKNISVNESLNRNRNIINYNYNYKKNNIAKMDKRYHNLTIKNINNSRNNDIFVREKYQSKSSTKKSLRLFSYNKRVNLSDIKAKLNFNDKKKINNGKEKVKFKLINMIQSNKNKNNSPSLNKKEKLYKLKLKKF